MNKELLVVSEAPFLEPALTFGGHLYMMPWSIILSMIKYSSKSPAV